VISIDIDICRGCGICEKNCPVGAIAVVNKKAIIDQGRCVGCGVCVRLCNFHSLELTADQKKDAVECKACPVRCRISPGFYGACKRYINVDGRLVRSRKLVFETVPGFSSLPQIERPLVTGVGAGTTSPDLNPAPYIVTAAVDGIDVVTTVTESPLSYSAVEIKIDTDFFIGEEGARVRRDGDIIGMVEREEYGSKMISIGGANILTTDAGFIAARTIVEICNGEKVILKVEKGARLELQVGTPPVVNGKVDSIMRVGCGSATVGMFADQMASVVEEVIVLDSHVVGLLSEHAAGENVGMKWSGVVPNARKSTRGRYFGEHGNGWGGTSIENPCDAIMNVDMSVASVGMRILVTETTGRKAALFTVTETGGIEEIPLTEPVMKVVNAISSNCETARVSAIYAGGTGGSARVGVSRNPISLTRAVHSGEARLTIGGAPAFILPGGGINFRVDVEKMVSNSITWVPTPATVAPVEYTMTMEKYREIGGHMHRIIDRKTLERNMKNDEEKL
jgi:ferredoxin